MSSKPATFEYVLPKYTVFVFLISSFLFSGCAGSPEELHQQRTWIRPETSSAVGVHMLLTDGNSDWPLELWESHLHEARTAVGPWGYVIVLLRLDDLDPNRWRYFMQLCTQLELTPIFRLATTHAHSGGWTAPSMDADGTYHTTAQRYAKLIASIKWPSVENTGGHYVIVGNEPNRGDEWGGRPNPVEYARFLADVATTLHATDPDLFILNAGFDLYAPHTGDMPLDAGYFMDAETFMDEMVAAVPEVFSHVDIWSSHSYPLGPFTAEPSYQLYQRDMIHGAENPNHLPPTKGIYNRGISAYQWELFKLESYGLNNLPVFITETGWRHQESILNSSDSMERLPNTVTIARYMREARAEWESDSQIEGVIFFAFDGHPRYWGHTNWLKLDERGEVVGRYEKLFDAAQTTK